MMKPGLCKLDRIILAAVFVGIILVGIGTITSNIQAGENYKAIQRTQEAANVRGNQTLNVVTNLLSNFGEEYLIDEYRHYGQGNRTDDRLPMIIDRLDQLLAANNSSR